jgi:hemerythrin
MALLQWKDEYAIGVRSVDHEHRALIDIINLLGDQLDANKSAFEIYGTLGEIRTLIAAHFALEEHVMRDLRYDEYAAHKADHEHLLDEIRDIVRTFEDGSLADHRAQLGERVGSWFARHFESFDARLHKLTDAADAIVKG